MIPGTLLMYTWAVTLVRPSRFASPTPSAVRPMDPTKNPRANPGNRCVTLNPMAMPTGTSRNAGMIICATLKPTCATVASMSPRSSAHQRSALVCPLSAIRVFSVGPIFAATQFQISNVKFQI